MIYHVQYGTSVIQYSVTRANRKTLAIEVHPDLSIKIVAPEKATRLAIEEKILKRAQWIRKQQYYFEQFLPRAPKREYVSGESHHYLGRKYILRIRKSIYTSVRLKGGDIAVKVKDTDNRAEIKKILNRWYHQHAIHLFEESLKNILPYFKSYHIEKPSIVVKKMPKRWGSCTPLGKIFLNPEIIKAPRKCIDYVIIHELCHLIHLNHSQAFYDMQTKIMPDWEKWKLRLERSLN